MANQKWVEAGFWLFQLVFTGLNVAFLLAMSMVFTQIQRVLPTPKPEPAAPPPPRMLSEVVREKLRAGRYSRRTEEAYLGWIKRYVRFHGRRHPREMGAAEVVAFLEDLAGPGRVSASTQNQAL